MDYIILLILLPIACEAITEIIGSSDVFKPLREYTESRKIPILSNLLDCKYCLSVWISMIIVMAYFVINVHTCFIMYLIYVLVVHRLANLVHILMDCLIQYKYNLLSKL